MRIRTGLSCALRASVVLLLMAGCAQLPVEEVKRYSGAFEQVRGITETLIDDYDSARKVASHAGAPTTPPRFPASFDPQEFLVAPKRSDDITTRRAALDAVSKYNAALVALADGRGVEAAKAAVASVLGPATTFLPQLGIAAPMVTAVVGAVENARSQAEFVRAYRDVVNPDPACTRGAQSSAPNAAPVAGGPANTRQCGPLIRAIFAVLIADTAGYYGQRVELSKIRSEQVKQPGTRLLTRSINGVTANYAPPPPQSPLLDDYLAMAGEYRRISVQLIPNAAQSFAAGTQAYDDEAQTELRGLLGGLREIAGQEQKIVDDLNAYHARLIDYVRLLERTDAYLDAVGEALERPADVDALAVKVLDLGSTVRRDGGDLRGAFFKLLAP